MPYWWTILTQLLQPTIRAIRNDIENSKPGGAPTGGGTSGGGGGTSGGGGGASGGGGGARSSLSRIGFASALSTVCRLLTTIHPLLVLDPTQESQLVAGGMPPQFSMSQSQSQSQSQQQQQHQQQQQQQQQEQRQHHHQQQHQWNFLLLALVDLLQTELNEINGREKSQEDPQFSTSVLCALMWQGSAVLSHELLVKQVSVNRTLSRHTINPPIHPLNPPPSPPSQPPSQPPSPPHQSTLSTHPLNPPHPPSQPPSHLPHNNPLGIPTTPQHSPAHYITYQRATT